MLNRNTIITYLKQHKSDFTEKYSIDKIGLFGSFATQKNVDSSDIDIVYETSSKGLTFTQMISLENELTLEFGKDIDLVNFNATYNKNTIELDGKMYNYLAYALGDGILKASFNLSADYLNFNDLMASSEVSESNT